MKPVIIMYCLLIPEVALFILVKHAKKETVAVILKALCTTTILLTAIAEAVFHEGGSAVFILLISAGLALGLSGDVAICADFIAGMALFGLGHLCYIAAFLQLSVNVFWAIPIFVVLYVSFILVIRKKILLTQKKTLSDSHIIKIQPQIRMSRLSHFTGESSVKSFQEYRVPVMIYGFIILAMLSMAITLPFYSLAGGSLALLAAILFVVSDSILAYNNFTRYNRRLDTLSLFCYFTAQSLFAVSVLTLS